MEALSMFLMKSIMVSGLLTIWYVVALRGRRLHQYNRFFLLSAMFASLTLPLLHFHLFELPKIATAHFAPVQVMGGDIVDAGKTIIHTQDACWYVDRTVLAGTGIALISAVLLLILSLRIIKVWRMCRQYPATRLQGIRLLLTDSPSAPFTFLRNLFWNKSIAIDGEVGQLIFKHELAHIEQGHTYDKLCCQIVTCIFWFNPFYWIIQKELDIVHEFIADEQAVGDRDTSAFAMMLLQSYNNGSYLAPEHHFSSSTIKRRLAMLQNSAAPAYAGLRRMMVLPLMAGAVLLFSFGTSNNVAPAAKKIVVLVDAGHGGKDAGERVDGVTEKELCLRYAKRLKEMAATYNIDVQLTRSGDYDMPLADRIAIAGKVKPDVLVSLHIGDKPGKVAGKGDYDILVSGSNSYAQQSGRYGSAIFQAMEEGGIIPGVAKTTHHEHNSTCGCSGTAYLPEQKDGVYVLKHAPSAGLVMKLGNINSKEDMRNLSDATKADALCRAILKGIVAGNAAKEQRTGAELSIDNATGNMKFGGGNSGCQPPVDTPKCSK